jgi:formate hydrogenlyase subunit 3/multisubunit Na+/H+ antiporter MnhD subunit
MTFAGAIFLIVVGAILRWGVNLNIKHVNEHMIGLILIIAGLVGLAVAFFQTALWARISSRRGTRYGDGYYDDPRY